MILRATSDLHLTGATAPLVFAALAELRADAEARGGATVLCGDILDQAEQVHAPTLVRLRDTLLDWPGDLYVIAGNHDQFDDKGRTALEFLEGRRKMVHVVTRPCHTVIGRMIPYVRPAQFADALEAAKIGRPMDALRVVWCHAGFQGAYRNAMKRDGDGVLCSVIPEDHVAVTGHYHCPQNLGNVVYCGSPYQTSFAEEGQVKGWLTWDDIQADPIPVRVAYGFEAPRHHTIHWDPEVGPPVIPDGLVRGADKVRVVTKAPRKSAVAASKQLADVGLAGAAILATPDSAPGRGIVEGGMTPDVAAGRYAVAVMGPDRARWPDPGEMDRFAEEHQLWAGL